MTNKTKITTGTITIVLFLGIVGSAFAYNRACTIPEAQMIREAVQTGNPNDPATKAKLAGLPALERVEAKICALQKLTPEETAKIIAKKKAMAGFIPSPNASKLPPVTLGIQTAISPDILGQKLILGTNSWTGYVGGKFVVVTGTADKVNPLQGVLFIMNDFTPIGAKAISAPTATGPLKIVSEANDILVLQSVAGTYEAYDLYTNKRHYVTTKGGTTYKFDLKTRTFK
ncbi:MAG TPA: hypothetical protein ENJ75_02630 [Candidatus Kaiserbacteria bacterium]|nr:hypothetical protein [Candidatus Kaiserbacteria bacterium]